jgi:hypothetical protein
VTPAAPDRPRRRGAALVVVAGLVVVLGVWLVFAVSGRERRPAAAPEPTPAAPPTPAPTAPGPTARRPAIPPPSPEAPPSALPEGLVLADGEALAPPAIARVIGRARQEIERATAPCLKQAGPPPRPGVVENLRFRYTLVVGGGVARVTDLQLLGGTFTDARLGPCIGAAIRGVEFASREQAGSYPVEDEVTRQ